MDWFAKVPVGEMPGWAAERWPAHDALVYREARWTFTALAAEVDRIARGLVELGVGPADRVAVDMENRPEWLMLAWATAKVGAALVPVPAQLAVRAKSPAQPQPAQPQPAQPQPAQPQPNAITPLASFLRAVGATVLVASPESASGSQRRGAAEAIAALLRRDQPPTAHGEPAIRHLILTGERAVEGALAWSRLRELGSRGDDDLLRARAAAVEAARDPLLVTPASARRGALRHGHALLRQAVDGANRLGVTPGDVLLSGKALGDLDAYTFALMGVCAGATQVLIGDAEPDLALAAVERHRCSVLLGGAAHFTAWMDARHRRPRQRASLRAGLLVDGDWRAMREAVARAEAELCPLLSAFGAGGAYPWATMAHPSSPLAARRETVGFSMPGIDVAVVDPETQTPVPPGEVGEIRVRSYLAVAAEPPAEVSLYDAPGWLFTDARGRLRPDGHLVLAGS